MEQNLIPTLKHNSLLSLHMTGPFRLLAAANSSPTNPPPPEQAATVDSDFVVILSALLCALICVLGLIAVARCAWLRRLSGGSASNPSASSSPTPPANKGLKKKILKSLPKATFAAESSAKFSDCAICLTEFMEGDEIRVLPQCDHGFHVVCIDTWLGSHSSCPSCRQILVVARCHKCGGLPGPGASTSETDTETRLKECEDDVNRFLP